MLSKSKEELEKTLAKVGVTGEWVEPDEYGFSRTFRFKALDQIIDIEWYCNYSTLIIGNAESWFTEIGTYSGYPRDGKWIEFKMGVKDTNPVHLRIK